MASTALDIVMSARDEASAKIRGLNSTIGGLKFGALASMGASAISTLTGSIGGFAQSTMQLGMDFSSAMSEVSAISGSTGGDLEKLSATARQLGATTIFSATEAAEGLKYMAMAGWDTQQMIDGLPAALDLAAASGESLGATSDIVTDAMTAFGMQANEAGRFADVLAVTSNKANTNVGMLGESFKYVAPVAGAMGYSVEDTSVALGLMANSGIKASSAGTQLRTIISNMSKPTGQMATAMEELGLSLTDSSGNMKSFGQVTDDLRTAFAGLSEDQKAQYAATLAGKEGMSGLLAIVNSSEADINKLRDAMQNCNGAASQMAATANDNLAGDLKNLSSAWQEAQLKIAEAFEPALRKVVQFITGNVIPVIDRFASFLGNLDLAVFMDSFADSFKSFDFGPVAALIPVLVSIGLVGGGLAKKIGNPFSGLLGGGRRSGGILKSLGTGFGNLFKGIGAGLKSAFQGVGDMISKVEVGFGKMARSIMTASKAANPVSLLAFSAVILALGAAIALVATQSEGLSQIFTSLGTAIATVVSSVGEAVGEIAKGIGEGLGLMFAGIAPVAEQLAVLVTAFMDGFAQIAAFLPPIIDSLGNLFTQLGTGISVAAQGIGTGIQSILTGLAPIVESVGNTITNVVGILTDGVVRIVEIVAPKFNELVQIISDAIVKIVETLAPYTPEITKIVEATSSAISDICDSFNTLVENVQPILEELRNILEQLGDTIEQVLGAAGDVIQDFGNAARNVLDGISGIFDSIGNAALNAGKGFQLLADGITQLVGLSWGDLTATLGSVAGGIAGITGASLGLGDTGAQMKALADGMVLVAQNMDLITTAGAQLPLIVSQFQQLTGLSEPLTSASVSMAVFADFATQMVASLVTSSAGLMAFTVAMSGIASSSSGASSGVAQLAGSISRIPASTSAASAGLSALGGIARTAFAGIAGAANSMSVALTSAFAKAQANAIRSLTAITSAMKSAVSVATASGLAMGVGFTTGLSSGLNRSVSVARSASVSISSALRSAASSAYSTGVMIGAGLANGMASQLGRVESIAARLANAAAEATRKAAQVRSPSRVFMKIGSYIGEGLEVGISSMVADVQKASERLVSIPTAGQMAFAGIPGGMTVPTSLTQTSDAEDRMVFEIHVHSELDGDELAHKIYKAVGSEIKKDEDRRKRLGGVR